MKRSPVSSLVLTSVCVSSLGSSPSYFRQFATVLEFTYPCVFPLFLLDIIFRVLPVSLPVSFRFYYTYFISSTFLLVLWFSFTWSFCSSLFYLKTIVGMQFGRFLRAGLLSNGSVRSRVRTVSIEHFARLATRTKRFSHLGPLRCSGRT